jgi:glycosyltransferase involved in cell wall biosynthesis
MQAMACGLAVVTTPVGSIAEIVSDARTGLLVAPEDPQALRGAIEGLLDDPARRAELGAGAAREAAQRFGEARMVDAMLEVFRDVAGRPRG